MAVHTEGLQSGTLAANVLLADTGPVTSGGGYQFPTFWISSSVSATIEIQHRNAANNGNVWAHRFYVTATTPFVCPTPAEQTIELDTNERVRVLLITGLLGSVQATILSQV